jgi:PrtD family type I secretion system ABC transporter
MSSTTDRSPQRGRLQATPLNAALNSTRPAIIVAVVFSLFINLLALVSPLYMLQVYDRVLSSRNVYTLFFITVIAIVLFVIYAALEALRTQVLVRAGIKFDTVVRGPIFQGALESTLAAKPGGPQVFRDGDTVREFLTGAGLIAFCDAPWIPVFVAVCSILHWFFGVLAIVAGLIIFALAVANDFATRAPIQKATTASIAAQNDVTATLRNSEVMHAMGMWGGLQARWQERRDDLVAWQALASDKGGGIMAGIRFTRQVVQTLILGGGAYLAINGVISPGAMIAASILVGRALAPIEMGVGQWKSFIAARGAWDRVQAMFRSQFDNLERLVFPAPKGRLHVDNVVIGPPNSQRPTLQGVSFTLEPGTALGIIGPSAAGKSSLVRGIVGVWPSRIGVVRLDGFDLRHWDLEQLGSHIGYLPQDVELFSGTVAQNIARFTDFKMDDVIEAASIAGVHDMIQAMPDGYSTQIGDAGAQLSGGQRQRVGLARTLFRKPPLLVLDEPNANLDEAGEAALAAAIAQLKPHSTIIFVTHKPNLLSLADKILVLQAGRAVQFGDRDAVVKELIAANQRNTPRVVPAKA